MGAFFHVFEDEAAFSAIAKQGFGHPEARWIYHVQGIWINPNREITPLTSVGVLLISRDGKWLNGHDGRLEGYRLEDDPNGEYAHYILANCISPCLWALSLIHCRNIELIDHEPTPTDSATYEREFGQPMVKYKTLAIKQASKRYERDDDQPSEYQDIMPLHIRRGNFAHYTEDAPLFGKFTGTFWRPATTVGNAKNGIVVKDYRVELEDKNGAN